MKLKLEDDLRFQGSLVELYIIVRFAEFPKRIP